MKKDGGFSLIELIIVIAIMAVLVALIAPNLTKYLSQAKHNTDLHNANDLADSILTCLTDYEINHGNLISAGGSPITLTWTGKTVSGGPTAFNTMLDATVNKDPQSREVSGAAGVATATISLKNTSPEDGYNITVTIGKVTATK